MDALSDVLRAVRVRGAVVSEIRLCEPWVVEMPEGRSVAKSLIPGAEELISYYVMLRKSCWMALSGEPAVRVSPGEVVVFPHGDAVTMSSAPAAMPSGKATVQEPFTIFEGDGSPDDAALLLAIHLGCDPISFNPLLVALPSVVHIVDCGHLNSFVQFITAEMKIPRLGGAAILEHVTELMVATIFRRYFEVHTAEEPGWLAALRDPFVGKALAALHENPGREWNLEALARDVGLSRSALAERFTRFVGQPAMQYLTNWRMQLAANDLRGGVEGIAAIAERVGYESEAAFSRAFKKVVGVPPSRWRTLHVEHL